MAYENPFKNFTSNLVAPKIIINPRANSGDQEPDPDHELLKEIYSDFSSIGIHANAENIQYTRRSWVRTFFSLLDAYAFILKNRVIYSINYFPIPISEKERKILLEEYKNSKGKIVKYYPEFKTNLRIAIRLYARTREVQEGIPDKFKNFPSELEFALKIRHRITHPKKLNEFKITSDEYSTVIQLNDWVKNLLDWRYIAEMSHIDKLKVRNHESLNELREMIENDLAKLKNST